MYEKHYGLTTKPFSIVPNPDILYRSRNHENALTYLEYGLREKVGFILLTGEIGSGKTTLIRYMLNDIDSQTDVAVIFNTNFSADQLLRRILSEFEISCGDVDKERHLETLYRFLIERYAQGRYPLVIIDEAQNLSDDALEDIRMLSNLQTDKHILLQIMLVGQTELRNRLISPVLRQVAQRIAVNYHLSPLDAPQANHYIAYRIQKAGGPTDLFSTEAMNLIYENSGGIPRTINILCDAGLVYGYAENRQRIDRAMMQRVLDDRICLSVASQDEIVHISTETKPAIWADILWERLNAIENALADFQDQQKTFMRNIRSEMELRFHTLIDTARKHESQPDKDGIVKSRANHVFEDRVILDESENENELRPGRDLQFNPAIARQATHTEPKSFIPGMKERLFLSLQNLAKSRDVRTFSKRYQYWLILLLATAAILGLMFSMMPHPPERSTSLVMDSGPPPALVSLPYEEEQLSLEATPDSRQAATKAPASKKTEIVHVIQAGETLTSIARNYSISVESIILANNLRNAHLINIGQKLKIPRSSNHAANP